MLSTADHLNHAIPQRHDVEAAVQRLVGAGLVSVADGWFRITAEGEQLWRTRPRAGVATMVDTVQGVLTRRHAPGSAQWTWTRTTTRPPSRNTRSGRFRPRAGHRRGTPAALSLLSARGGRRGAGRP